MNPGAVYHMAEFLLLNMYSELKCYTEPYLNITFYSIPTQTFAFSINKAVFYYSQQILSSALDHAIQTANSLKKATERMVQAVSEDLAKVKKNQL